MISHNILMESPAGADSTDGGTDLVIIVLNEFANAGLAVGCQATICDFAATIPPAPTA